MTSRSAPQTQTQALYKAVKQVFAQLPLAALVQGTTLILHGETSS
jgi:hypothetical protein